jgi:hypothetical protein
MTGVGKYVRTPESRERSRLSHLGQKGVPHTEEYKKKLSERVKGKGNPMYGKGRIGKDNPMFGKKRTLEARKKTSDKLKGDKHPCWKGGLTEKNQAIRSSFEYKLWREAVFKRDNWTCIWCGYKGKELQADHIKPFALFPELRFSIDNGRTLCKKCHRTTETFANRIWEYKTKNIREMRD